MPVIRCTQKLLKEIGVNTSSLKDSNPSGAVLGDWYANMIKLSGSKCILFVNERTLFSFLVLKVPRTKLSNLKNVFIDNLKQTLIHEDIDKQVIKNIINQYLNIEYGKTNNRNIVASMNHIAFIYDVSISLKGGIRECNIQEIIHNTNRTFHKNTGMRYPDEILKDLIESGLHDRGRGEEVTDGNQSGQD